VSARAFFTAVGLVALAAGGILWWATQPRVVQEPGPGAVTIAPAALYAIAFTDAEGRPQSLGRFQGRVLVLNFWATWCAPCREEMPAFTRLQAKWGEQGVQFVGLSAEEPGPVARFGRELGINYPLWTGGEVVGDLARRLGNSRGVLPYSVIFGPGGEVLAQKVGPYREWELDAILQQYASKRA
jgi:thiol-disulfide isomerase/thioredoxin